MFEMIFVTSCSLLLDKDVYVLRRIVSHTEPTNDI